MRGETGAKIVEIDSSDKQRRTEVVVGSRLQGLSGRAGTGRWLLLWGSRFVEFAFVQGWVQLLTAIAGVIIVRTMSKEQYALYGIANGMQSTINVLAGLGIGVGVESIGGRVWHDRERFGQLLSTALRLRHTFAVAAIGFCLPVAAWMLHCNGSDWLTALLLCAVIVATVLPQLSSNVLEAAIRLHGAYRCIQKLDLANAVVRLAAIGILAVSFMNAWLAASVAAIVAWRRMRSLRQRAISHANFSAPVNDEDRQAMRQLAIRMFPNTVFYCFQGQVTLLILTYFGNPTGIADVTALGRLSALLMAFSLAFNTVLVPRFTRCQDGSRLTRLYLGLVAATALLAAPAVLVGWFAPRPLLWLLGSKYMGLERECGWVVTTACVSHVALAMNQMNGTKSWIRIGTVLYVPVTIAVQVIALTVLDVSQISGVLVFGLVTCTACFPTLIADAILGLRAASNADLLRIDAQDSI